MPLSVSGRIADALFPKTRQRLIGLLFGRPDQSFYTNELVRLAGSGIGGVQRELLAFKDAGLVTMHRVGNQTHYQANPDSPVFVELCGLAKKTSGVVDALRAALLPLAPALRAALLYGSVAAGTDHSGSDLDVLLVSDTLTLEAVFEALAPLEAALGRHVSPTLYTSAELARRRAEQSTFVTRLFGGPHVNLLDGAAEASHGEG